MISIFHDLRQTKEWASYLASINWLIEELPIFNSQFSNSLYIRKIPLLPFSIAKLQRPSEPIDFEKLDNVCKKNRIVVLYFEPNLTNHDLRFKNHKYENRLHTFGFRNSRGTSLSRKTIWIDLKKSRKELLSEMKSKTRYNIGLAKRRGVKLHILDGGKLLRSPLLFDSFIASLRDNARRLKIFAMPKKWFKAQVKAFGIKCFVVLAYVDGDLVAGNFFMTSRNACFHSHNGSTQSGRKLMAPTLCVWEGMLEAKRRKLKVFDFDGIYDESRVLRRWKGFSRFKKGFGGKEIDFVGQFVKLHWPF